MGEIEIPEGLTTAVYLARRKGAGTLVLCEVDGLNDKKAIYGRSAIARMLSELKELFAKHFKGYGEKLGEERLYSVLPGSGDHRTTADNFRRAVEEFNFLGELKSFRATVSIGMATLAQSGSVVKLLELATTALREVQAAGGNRVKLAPKHRLGKSERNRPRPK
ncbi:MAG TPA: diguanylate cyclase [Planctomycetota bacterium]|nr:diguanylate cyclase [Planctomycetota bacterium]